MKKIFTFILLMIAGTMATITAQTDTTLFIEEIIIKGKSSEYLQKTTINSSSLQLKDIHDVGEIFADQPGFGVIKRGNFAMEPVLRGFKYEQLTTIYNSGATSTNACPNRMDPAISQISPEEIEKIELIKGPYSVRYGPSFAGLINIVTKKPAMQQEETITGSIDGGFQSNGGNAWGGLNLFIARQKTDLTLSAGYKDFGNYESGSGQEISSSFRRVGYAVKLGYNPVKNHRLQLNWKQGFASDIMHAGLPMDADKDNSSLLSVDYRINHLSDKIVSLRTKLFGSYVDHEMSNTNRPNYAMVHAVTPVTAKVFGGNAELGMMTSSNNMIYIGADYKYVNKDGARTREVYVNACTGQQFDPPKTFEDLVWQNSDKKNMGVFIENRFQVGRDLLWVSGGRVDFTGYDAKDPAPDFLEQYNNDIKPENMTNFSVNTSLTWQAAETLELQWAVGRGVRTPELEELYINHFSIGMDAYEYLGNPNLKSEKNYQTDIRVEKRWESLLVYGNVFYSYLNDYIIARLDTTLDRKFLPCNDPKHAKRFTNIDQAYMYGFEAGMKIQFLEHFKYALSAGYTYAQNQTWDEPLPEIPPFMINTELSYYTEKFEAEIKGRIAAEQDRISESFAESTTPGFAVFDVRLHYLAFGILDIFGSVTNIFNTNYVEHLSRAYKNMNENSLYYEPGRSFNIGMKIKF
jgi:iron complex outermembrane recepter protein